MSVNEDDRRPIAQRERAWAKALTRWLVKSGVTPNFISFTSIVFAALAGACFYAISLPINSALSILMCLGAALFCQLRLLANMMDGMVAVEGGKGGPDGPVWNELPDRFADIFVLVGAGYGVAAIAAADLSHVNPSIQRWGLVHGDELGWAAAVAAVMTAYVREVARGAGAPNDFSGPMAKPQRMFVMTMAALIAATAPLWAGPHPVLYKSNEAAAMAHIIHAALWIVLIGAVFTALNRTRRALAFLNRR